MKRSPHRPQSAAAFIVIGAGLMLGLEFMGPGGLWEKKQETVVPAPQIQTPAEEIAEADVVTAPAEPAPVEQPPVMFGPSYGPVLDRPELADIEDEKTEPLWRVNAVAAPPVPEGFARVVIIIDDLGMDRKHSQEILALPGPLTAAFLPYAENVAAMAADAKAAGHELMIHMPMEPTDATLNMGEIALRTNMEEHAFDAMLDRAFASFDGYVGLNNHMGSRLTQDSAAMNRLMTRLGTKGMLFVDSKTIGSSVAAYAAQAHHVPHAERDVFLDHDPDYQGVVSSLSHLEAVARRNGTAIAIGHPKPGTIQALKEWIPTLPEKKLVLVPVSAVIADKSDP